MSSQFFPTLHVFPVVVKTVEAVEGSLELIKSGESPLQFATSES